MSLQSAWYHLLPFLASAVMSLTWFVPKPTPDLTSIALKCLPVVMLAVHLLYLEQWSHREANLVFVALLLSALGDAFLVFPKSLGRLGIIAFGLAQVVYACAFGFHSVTWVVGLVLYLFIAALFTILFIRGTIPPAYRSTIPIMVLYAVVIATMLWRALDRFHLKDLLPFERRFSTSLGAIIFVLSDLSIVFLQAFGLIPQPYSKFVTMSTYYAAQLLITLGASKNFWKVGLSS